MSNRGRTTEGGDAVTRAQPANDNALEHYLRSDAAQAADPSTVLQLTRLAKCGRVRLSTQQMLALQRAIETA